MEVLLVGGPVDGMLVDDVRCPDVLVPVNPAYEYDDDGNASFVGKYARYTVSGHIGYFVKLQTESYIHEGNEREKEDNRNSH